MTQLCWSRLNEILWKHGKNISVLSLYNSDPRLETHRELMMPLMKLPENVLQELNLFNVNIECIHPFLHRQATVKILSITGNLDDINFLKNFRLIKLKLVGPKTRKLAEIFNSQPDLMSLKFTTDKETEYDENVFEEIVKLQQLETLDVPILNTFSHRSVRSVNRLRNLKKLSISCNDLCVQSLISSSIPSLQQLDINFEEFIPVAFIETLSQNIPNLKVIKFRGSLVTNFLNDIPVFFSKLESLWLINVESFFVNILNLRTSHDKNSNLKHLFVVNHDRKVVICTNDMIRFIKMFPKLETLVLTKFIEIQLSDLETILRNLPDLKEIVIDSKSIKSTIKVMSLIGIHGKKLSYVKFENFKHASNIDSLRVFFDGKFSVIEKIDGNLILRQRKKSFLSRIMD